MSDNNTTQKIDTSVITECSETLTVLSEFEEFCTPVDLERNAEVPMGKLSILPEKAEERKAIRRELLKDHLNETKTVAPFLVWRWNKKLIIIDGRHEEYFVAKEMGFPIRVIEFKFDNLDRARIFVMKHVLNNPHLNAPQRMMLVLKLKKTLQAIAKEHYQGKRNDLHRASKQEKEQFHTMRMMAALANVSETSFRRFVDVIEKGPIYLQKDKAQEFFDRILASTMSINQAHNSLKDAIKVRNEDAEFRKSHPELYVNRKMSASNMDNNDNTADYENPSFEGDNFHNKIVCGDRIQMLRQLADACCNLVFTSPEFNVPRIHYHVDVPVLPYYAFLEKLNVLWVECARILKNGGRLAIDLPALVSVFEENNTRAFNTPLFVDIINSIKQLDVGLNLREILVWRKLFPIRRHRLSSPSPKNVFYRGEHDPILIFSKNQWEMIPENENAPHDLTKAEYEEFSSSVISLPPQSKGVADHPAVFPESLAERIIRMHSFVGDTVIDPCNGSGTTTTVSARYGRRWFGCDISYKYCKAAEARTQKAYKEYLNKSNQAEDVKIVDDEIYVA